MFQTSFTCILALCPFLQSVHKILHIFLLPRLCFYCSRLTSHYTSSLQYLIHTNKLPHNYLKHLTCIHTSILILIGSAFLKFVSFSYLILTLCFPWQKSLGAFKSFRMKLNQKVCWRKALNTFQMLPGIHPKLVWSKTRLQVAWLSDSDVWPIFLLSH